MKKMDNTVKGSGALHSTSSAVKNSCHPNLKVKDYVEVKKKNEAKSQSEPWPRRWAKCVFMTL